MYLEITLIAYLIDRVVGEFNHIRHPVVIMGDYIKWYEQKFYRDSFIRGMLLSLSLISIVFILAWLVDTLLSSTNSILKLTVEGLIASSTIASKMLYDSVYELIINPKKICYLVSRDTENLSSSDINKAGVETYSENLSDGVIAPLFYLLIFGIEGAFIYKAINTLDSMVGYRTKRYENFGKFSAKLDDIANFIPSRITALLILLLMPYSRGLKARFEDFKSLRDYAKGHDSPNAGYPISAMALALDIRLGGDTSYFGQIKSKPYFGKGRSEISKDDIRDALTFRNRFDFTLLIILGGLILWV